METFSALLAICAGNSPVPVNSRHKGQCRGTLMFSLMSAWINGWVKQSRGWWFKKLSRPLWRHHNEWVNVLNWLGQRDIHVCISKLTIIGLHNGLSPGRRLAIILSNAEILLIGSLGTDLSEISIWIQTFLFKKGHLKMSSVTWCPFCLGLNILMIWHHHNCLPVSCIEFTENNWDVYHMNY